MLSLTLNIHAGAGGSIVSFSLHSDNIHKTTIRKITISKEKQNTMSLNYSED